MIAPTTEQTRQSTRPGGGTTPTESRGSDLAQVVDDLRAAHLEAAQTAAALDLDQVTVWNHADAVIATVSSEAYRVIALLNGRPATGVADRVPPIVRLRELATVQAQLERTLNHQLPLRASLASVITEAAQSAWHVRLLAQQLRLLTG